MHSALLVNNITNEDTDFLRDSFEQWGYSCTVVHNLHEAEHALENAIPDLALINPALPDGNGLSLLDNKRFCDVSEIFLLQFDDKGEPNISRVRSGYGLDGADRLDSRMLEIAADVTEAVSRETLVADVLGHLQSGFCRLRGSAPVMEKLYATVRKVAPTEAVVLLVGESGSGKELVADAIHKLSGRAGKPFIIMNCGAVSPEIMESELFGHEKGAFTGATKSHIGFFERAHGGTLFLDEITEMPLELQVKLLRILESGRFNRVGGETEIAVNVRVISATNRRPAEAIAKNLLREDLYFRLSQFPLEVPPLRRRVEDIPLLARYFLEEANRRYGKHKIFSAEAMATLQQYAWPGNVRELKNAVERAYIVSNLVIESRHFHIDGVAAGEAQDSGAAHRPWSGRQVHIPLGTSIREAEMTLITATLAAMDYSKPETARVLGISLKTLYNKLRKYGIN